MPHSISLGICQSVAVPKVTKPSNSTQSAVLEAFLQHGCRFTVGGWLNDPGPSPLTTYLNWR